MGDNGLLAQCRIFIILSKKIEEPPIQFSIICEIEIGLWVCLVVDA